MWLAQPRTHAQVPCWRLCPWQACSEALVSLCKHRPGLGVFLCIFVPFQGGWQVPESFLMRLVGRDPCPGSGEVTCAPSVTQALNLPALLCLHLKQAAEGKRERKSLLDMHPSEAPGRGRVTGGMGVWRGDGVHPLAFPGQPSGYRIFDSCRAWHKLIINQSATPGAGQAQLWMI